MSLNTKLSRFVFIITLIALLSCNTSKHSNHKVEAAMKQYDHLILKSDADGISMLYTPDGNLGDIAIGRDSIKKFLSGFKNVKVLSQLSSTTSIKIIHDTAIQKGTYKQTDLVDGNDTVHVKGEYTARWEWLGKKGWHIKRMTTKSTN